MFNYSNFKAQIRWIFIPGSENLTTFFCYEQSVLELGRSCSVNCGWSPFIWPSNVFPPSLVYHWFDSKDMSWFHKPLAFILLIMRNCWSTVEILPNSMACVASNHSKATFLGMFADRVSTVSVHRTWLANSYRFF